MSDASLPQAVLRKRFALPGFHPLTMACLLLLGLLIGAALFADLLAPYNYTQMNLVARNQPPLLFGGSWDHVFGTDEIGRDILSRVLYGLRTSIVIALIAATMSLVVGTTLGLVSGFFPGWIDSVIRVAVDFQASMPFILIALAVLAVLGNNVFLFVGLLGVYGWERYARLVRALVSLELSKGYVAALRRNGAGGWRIALGHVMPNVLPVIVVNLTVVLPEILLLESSLSFLGLGIQPPNISLGSMVGNGRNAMMTEWWIATIPGVVIFVLSLATSLLGDVLRDRLDPTLK